MKKLVSCFLIMCLFTSMLSLSSFASNESNTETHLAKEMNVTFERVIRGDQVIVNVRDLDGKLLHTILNNNGEVKVDGKTVNTEFTAESLVFDSNNLPLEIDGMYGIRSYSRSSLNWGSWSKDSTTISTGGYGAAVLAGIICAAAPDVRVRVVAGIAAATAGKYDEITIKFKTRYAKDNKYIHIEQVTTFYGDGKKVSVSGNPYKRTLKRPLDR